ncbi:nuclear pore complex NUP85 [Chlorella sorokiniana]|uniref:Nuclear pore complex protein Nup85 n=1 Tax=Chlorella sorokiniana TaxID=3076 RepID=A0A2P6THL1_CHLSO|nr:nuclear pore complex NUP85 [Chlorella sorokiniana]|eukprot:PRW33780.1 nuclear pore complex NUP85 [Chlorella sorokiniana]
MDGEPVELAAVPASAGSRLFVSWGLGNELHTVDLAPSSAREDSSASVVQWGQLSAGQRRVAFDSLGMYQQLQAAGHDPRGTEAWAAARRYAAAVSAILAADGVRGAEATAEELVTLQERALWDLLALFWVERPGAAGGQGLVAQDLARWVRSNAVAVSGGVSAQPLPPALLAALREAPLPESAAAYWPAVSRLAALGWIDDALELLGLHSAWLRYDGGAAVVDEAARGAVGALEAATLLLRRFPVLRQPGVSYSAGRELATPSELLAYRRTWQAQAAALLSDAQLWRGCEAGDKATAEGLRQLLRVLGGDDAALASATRSWLELLVAQLLHVYPSAQQPAELAQLAQRAYDAGGGASAPEFLQAASALLEAAVELDAQAAMRVCSALCSEWFMAHVPLLLMAHPSGAGVLAQELRHAGGSQVEFYTLEYAAALAPHGPTWPLAAAYLAWCPAHGQAALDALLRRLPLDAADAWPARKAAELAAFQGLTRVAEDIHRCQGVLCWQAGMVGAALSWLTRCDDVGRIDLALRPLADAVSAGRLDSTDAVALAALQPVLETLPAGSANAALLAVHRLLEQGQAAGSGSGGAGSMHAAVAALAQLPDAMRDSCLPLVCGALPAMPPGALSEADVRYLLQWLLGAEGRLPVDRKRQATAASIQASLLQTAGSGKRRGVKPPAPTAGWAASITRKERPEAAAAANANKPLSAWRLPRQACCSAGAQEARRRRALSRGDRALAAVLNRQACAEVRKHKRQQRRARTQRLLEMRKTDPARFAQELRAKLFGGMLADRFTDYTEKADLLPDSIDDEQIAQVAARRHFARYDAIAPMASKSAFFRV